MYIFAYICLLVALLCALGASGFAALQLWEQRTDNLKGISAAQWPVSACLLLASACLLHALFWQDYSLEYVASYTDRFLPVFYRLTAFWAGQPGSMLFWALVTALAGTLFAISGPCKRQPANVQLWFWCFFHAIMAFFCLVLTCWSNPFMAVEPAPVDGNGLNPLLQNPGMIIHPPLLFMGYALFTIPACLGLAQLLSQEPDNLPWPSATRSWYMLSWVLLTAGIILGAWWAYMELGWGGYWAWDPVENASLLPWLTGTAAIHLIAAGNRTDKFGRASVALMAITVVASFFATYLTRSGVIQSVHAFGDGGVGTPLTIFVLAGLAVSIFVPLTARPSAQELASPFSREGALVLTTWLFLTLALIITLATMWPVISRIWGQAAQGLDASFYNRVCLPLGACLLLLLCLCFWLGWQGGLARKGGFYFTCGAFAAGLAAIWLAGYRQPLALFSSACAIAAICGVIVNLCSKGLTRRKIAVMGAHLGLAILALGVAFSGPYTTDAELFLSPGQTETLGAYTIKLDSIKDGAGQGYDFLQATLNISRDGKTEGVLKPERRMYAKFGDMQFSEVDVITGLGQDIYASLLGMDEDHRVLVKVSLEPLVNWIWIGGAIMCIVPLFGLGRSRKKRA